MPYLASNDIVLTMILILPIIFFVVFSKWINTFNGKIAFIFAILLSFQYASFSLTGYPRNVEMETLIGSFTETGDDRRYFETAFFQRPESIFIVARDIEENDLDTLGEPILYRLPWDDGLADLLQQANDRRRNGEQVILQEGEEEGEEGDQVAQGEENADGDPNQGDIQGDFTILQLPDKWGE